MIVHELIKEYYILFHVKYIVIARRQLKCLLNKSFRSLPQFSFFLSLLNKVPRVPKCPSAFSARVLKCLSDLSAQVPECPNA